jgi:hypothetical protein
MPVDFERYKPEDGRIDLTEGTNAYTLLSFLVEHPDVGFTPAELHEQTGVPRGSINPTLARLERAGLVRHKGDYWAAADDDRLAAASAAVLGLQAVHDAHSDDWYAQNTDWADDHDDRPRECNIHRSGLVQGRIASTPVVRLAVESGHAERVPDQQTRRDPF